MPGYIARAMNTKERTPLGERVERLFRAKGYSMSSFARALGIAPSSLRETLAEEGRVPSVQTALEMSRLLGVPIRYLIYGEGPKMNAPYDLPPDVADIATMLSRLPQRDRQAVKAMVETLYSAERVKK